MYRIIKYSMYDNSIMDVYDGIVKASEANALSTQRTYQMCVHKKGCKNPQLPYYLRFEGEPPEEHKVYDVYDEDFELIKTYFNIQSMSDDTGLSRQAIWKQLKNNRGVEMCNRANAPASGLYIEERIIK